LIAPCNDNADALPATFISVPLAPTAAPVYHLYVDTAAAGEVTVTDPFFNAGVQFVEGVNEVTITGKVRLSVTVAETLLEVHPVLLFIVVAV
jgi:hypothetical protein